VIAQPNTKAQEKSSKGPEIFLSKSIDFNQKKTTRFDLKTKKSLISNS